MTKKNARKTAARERQAKVGGKYMTHLEPKTDVLKLILAVCDEEIEGMKNPVAELPHSKREVLEIIRGLALGKDPDWYQVPLTDREKADRKLSLEKRVSDAFLVLNNGLYFTGKLAPTREVLFARIQQALQVLHPERTVLEQAGDELLSEKLDDMFGRSPASERENSAAQTLKFASDILDKGLAREKAAAEKVATTPINRNMFTVNDTAFNEYIRNIPPRVSERETLLNFLRWLRTSGPDAKTHDLVEAYCEAEARVEEYVKGGTARVWRVDNMGHAISKDVGRVIGTLNLEWERTEPFRDDTQWACRFKANGKTIEMTVTQNLIRLSTGSDDKAVGYHDQESAVQAILQYLNSNA